MQSLGQFDIAEGQKGGVAPQRGDGLARSLEGQGIEVFPSGV